MSAVIIFILILAILLVIFTLQNSIEITINAFFWTINDAPLVLVLIVCVIAGYLLGAIYLYPQVWQLKKENKKLKRANTRFEGQQGFKEPAETHPEGIEFTDDDEEDDEEDRSFFKE